MKSWNVIRSSSIATFLAKALPAGQKKCRIHPAFSFDIDLKT
jgi:hypothetical protein